MGEKEEKTQEAGKKAEEAVGEKKAAEAPAGDGTKEKAVGTVVLKLNLHCQGCAKKVRRLVSQFDGVVTIKADCHANKLIVMGNVDPFLLLEQIEQKTKKKVELISYPPQPTNNSNKKKADEKSDEKVQDKKGEENQKVPKVAVISTVVMKIKLHCDGCAHKIKRLILKNFDGINSVTMDMQKDLVTLTGTMDVNEVVSYLKEKLKRGVDIIPPKKDEEGKKEEKGGPTDKKQKESTGGGQEKKEKQGSIEGDEKKEGGSKLGGSILSNDAPKVELSKIEHHSYSPQTYYTMPAYHQSYLDQGGYGAPMYHYNYNQDYTIQYRQGPPPPSPTYVDSNDQVPSDENPSGCFVM